MVTEIGLLGFITFQLSLIVGIMLYNTIKAMWKAK